MSTGERTRPEEVGTDSSIDANDEYHGAEATRALRSAATGELTGRRLQAKLLPYGDPCRDHVVPFAGVIVGRDSDGRIRIRAGGAIRFAKPKRMKDVHLGAQIRRGDGPVPDGGTDTCPACGASAFYPNGAPGAHWCENCEREFWQEGGDWFSCGFDGEPRLVDQDVDRGDGTATDGGVIDVPAEHADRVLVDDSEPGQLTAAIQEGDVHAVLAFPGDVRQDDLDDAFAELLKEAHYVRDLQGGDRP